MRPRHTELLLRVRRWSIPKCDPVHPRPCHTSPARSGGNQCVAACGTGNNACSSACRQDHPCGAQDPIKPNSSTITSTMSSSSSRTASEAGATTDGSGGTIYSGFGGGASATGDSSSAEESSASSQAASDSGAGRASLDMGHTFGFLALAGAFFGGFALVL